MTRPAIIAYEGDLFQLGYSESTLVLRAQELRPAASRASLGSRSYVASSLSVIAALYVCLLPPPRGGAAGRSRAKAWGGAREVYQNPAIRVKPPHQKRIGITPLHDYKALDRNLNTLHRKLYRYRRDYTEV